MEFNLKITSFILQPTWTESKSYINYNDDVTTPELKAIKYPLAAT